jgi:hypothetical protein
LTYDGIQLLHDWRASQLTKVEFWRANHQASFTYPSMLGRMWRAEQKMRVLPRPELYGHDFGQPLDLTGDWMVIGDVHLPTTDYDFFHVMLAVAQRHLKRPRRCLVAGDLFNMDCFSGYADIIGLPNFRREIEAARHLLIELLEVFDEVQVRPGNHDRRAAKTTGAALLLADLVSLVTTNPRVVVSEWGHSVVHTPNGDYRVTHGSEYSVNQLVVADQLAQKYLSHVIGHHQHHLAKGLDRFKRFVVVDNGGLFDPKSLAYTLLDDSKKPRMAQGFTLLKGGFTHVFGPHPYTNYDEWLPSTTKAAKAVKVAPSLVLLPNAGLKAA